AAARERANIINKSCAGCPALVWEAVGQKLVAVAGGLARGSRNVTPGASLTVGLVPRSGRLVANTQLSHYPLEVSFAARFRREEQIFQHQRFAKVFQQRKVGGSAIKRDAWQQSDDLGAGHFDSKFGR